MSQRQTVIVIGAGAAGLIAAWRAASLGAPVILLEKNNRPGIKILLSGNGKCNITHGGSVESLLAPFRRNEALFLRPSFYRFTNRDIIEMLERHGLKTLVRSDGRIFPQHGTAKDVVTVLGRYLDETGVRLQTEAIVTDVVAEDGAVRGVRVGGRMLPSHHVVLAVGGCSYPGTGTTGDGWPWAAALGHEIVKPRAALAPIFLEAAPPQGWAGVALRDCLLRARQGGREIARMRGDLLFTHRGVSGPTVLGISRVVAERQRLGVITLEADLCPGLPFEALGTQIREWARANPRRSILTCVESRMPERLTGSLLEAAQVTADTAGAYLTRHAQNRLTTVLKGWPLGVVQHVPLEKGEVTAGGVALDEVDPQTMRSRCAAGLYLCGEILDIAGPIGGYNLQAAFSTGYVAGETAARDAGA